jgi:hypothetical protein
VRRTLYWKRLLLVAVALAAFCGAVFAVHRVQIKSQVVVFKEAAERAEAGIDGDPGRRAEAVALYAKYLKFRPTDEGAYGGTRPCCSTRRRARPPTRRPSRRQPPGWKGSCGRSRRTRTSAAGWPPSTSRAGST